MKEIKSIIEKIYKDYNPDKISNIPSLLEKYKGKESEMLIKMAEKYKIKLQDYIECDLTWLIKEIIKKYDSDMIPGVALMLSENAGKEKELLGTLVKKYNANLNDIIISVYLNSPAEILPKPIEPEPQVSAPLSFANNIQNEAPQAKKSHKLIIFGIPSILVIAAVLILYFTGVFSPSKKTNNYIAPTTSSISNTDNSESDNKASDENDYQSKVLATINSYYSDLNDKNFNANKYFATKVDRFILMLNATPSDINNYINTSYYKEFSEPNYKMEDNTYSIKQDVQDGYIIEYIESGKCFRTSKNQFQKTRTNIKALLDKDFKITFFQQNTLLENTFTAAESSSMDLGQLTIVGTNVNLRIAPAISGGIIIQLSTGDIAEILEKGNFETVNGKNDYWYKVKVKNQTGWVFGTFTNFSQEKK